ncbi:LysR family transcriptional regulator [Litoribrevibacter albus]|uniref:LysR family transcriptional regulator n=1 Tax=Litoribrevibacter albus TaxID=1473156 RepID=A0AA37SEM2_9GAMM|nr:LysR family transcriptional regulator [Litoribrevibacter albus]GLQ32644.1 LysR family transcriptional regulator [Litoribrevibacter albus]
MRYTFRQLEVFLAAAHFQNITKAADSLSMSQSAASSALKDIESQFDLPLFDRIGKRLQLNEQGRLIRPKAEQLIEQAKELERIMAQHKDAGHLKVGATLTIGNYLAVSTMAEMMQEQPDAEVSLSVANTSEIGQKVLNFEIDIGLIEGELQHQDLDVIPWRDDELVVFCAPEHPFADQLQLTDRQLKEAEWILRESGSGTRQAFDRAMHGVLPEIQVKLELQHTEAIKRAVSANLGIGCLSRVALEDAFKRGSLIPLPVPHRDFSRKFYFVIHKQKYRSAGIERWMELCRSSF